MTPWKTRLGLFRSSPMRSRRRRGQESDRGLIVLDTSYPSWVIQKWGTWEAVTCRDLGGYFSRVLTVNPLSSVAWGQRPTTDPEPKAIRIDATHSFIDGSHSRHRQITSLPGGPIADFLMSQAALLTTVLRWGWVNRASAVRAGDPLFTGLLGLIVSRGLGVPLVIRVGGNNARLRRELGRPLMPRLFRWAKLEAFVESFVLARAGAILPANDDYLEYVVSSGGRREICTVIRYGNLIDRSHFTAPSSRGEGRSLVSDWTAGQDVSLLLCVSRLESLKRIDDVLAVCTHLQRSGRDFQCLIVGEGSDEERLSDQIDALGLSKQVHLCGARSQEWLTRVLPLASVFISPLAGRALTEAALAAAPVAAYDVDWQSELIVDGETGLLAPVGDVKVLAEKVELLLADRKLAATIGNALRSRALNMMDPMRLNELERSVYDSLLGPR